MQKKIDLATYPRRSTYEAFLNHEVPVLSTTCPVDITALSQFREKHDLRFFPLMAFLVDLTVNGVEALRHRIVDEQLYEYQVVHPSFTTLLPDKTISFRDAVHLEDAKAFYRQILALSDGELAGDVAMGEKHGRYFISNIPWVGFSSFTHPYFSRYASIPIVTTGKFQKSGANVVMPVALQVHHSLVDGYHLGQFYSLLEEHLRNAPVLLEGLLS